MAAHCSFILSSTAFPTVCALYWSADVRALLILPLVNSFSDGSRGVLLNGWERIIHSFCRQRLSRRIARCIVPRVAADCSYLCSSTAFPTVCAPYCSADGSGLLILLLANGFYDGLHTVLLRGWQRISHSSACQWLSRPFARRMAQRMASDCSFFRSSTAFAVCAPFCPANGSGFLLLAVVNGFQYGLRAVLLTGW